MKYGTHFELQLSLALVRAFAYFCLLLLASTCFGLLWLLWLLALSVPLLLRFCLMLAHFSLLWLIFSIFLRILSHLVFLIYFFGVLARFFEVLGGSGEGF